MCDVFGVHRHVFRVEASVRLGNVEGVDPVADAEAADTWSLPYDDSRAVDPRDERESGTPGGLPGAVPY